MRNMTHALIRGSFFPKVNPSHVIRKHKLLPVLLARPHPSQKLRNIDPVLRSETIFMMNKTLRRNSVPLKNERKMTPLRRKIPFEISSMKLVLRANCTVKSINQPSWINILTELRTASALVAFLCTYRYGITGHAGAPASRILLLMYHYPWYLITYMLQTT